MRKLTILLIVLMVIILHGTCVWGCLQKEINESQYRTVAAWVNLRPEIIPQVNRVFSDNVINQGEFNAVRKAFNALDGEYKSKDLKEAKELLQYRLDENENEKGGKKL